MIYLASNSPRRQELLQQMGVVFEVIPQFAPEQHQIHESPERYVARLAYEKAYDGWSRQDDQSIPVLGSDTVVVLEGKILEKPKNKEHAIDMLLQLSGQTHQVITAIALLNKDKQQQSLSLTDVTFAKLDKPLCEAYWQTGEPVDKAGAYAIQGKGALFISHISGSYSAVMGLPIYETQQLLAQFSLPSMILKNTKNKR